MFEEIVSHRWNADCIHSSWSVPAYGYLANKLFKCEKCGQVSVIYPSSRDGDGRALPKTGPTAGKKSRAGRWIR